MQVLEHEHVVGAGLVKTRMQISISTSIIGGEGENTYRHLSFPHHPH